MRVICKKPKCDAELIEVAGIEEINKLVGNVDENGNGVNGASSDIRCGVLGGVDLYMKEDAVFNTALEGNLWTRNDNAIVCGTVVFAGYDDNKYEDSGAASLTDEQVRECERYISLKRI